jgi:outer membrane receptor protein involved in Fe transport
MNLPDLSVPSARPVRLACLALLGASALSAQTPPAPSTPSTAEPAVQMQAYAVTGSHIQRLDAASPQPVVAYTADDIANSGYTSLGDFMQAQSFNTGGQGNMLQTSTSGVGLAFSRGATTINPRGLGAGNFLVLVNGRRPGNYANPDTNGASVFDFKTLPAEAIDRVEFLKDGASAIYGSDAITGVMNIILKKSFSGVSVDASVGGATNAPTVLLRTANVLVGGANAKTSVLVDVSWLKQNGASINQYSRSKSGNYTYLGIKGSDTESTQAYPANVSLTAAQAKTAGLAAGAGYYVITGGQPTATPTLGNFTNVGAAANITDTNRNDLTAQGLVPGQENWNALLYLTHDFNAKVSAFAQLIGSDEKTHYLYAPTSAQPTSVAVSPSFETAIPNNAQNGLPAPTLIIPAANPYNPFNQNLTSFLMRADPGHPRMFDVESQSATVLAGLKGRLGGDWTWESGVTYSHDVFTQTQQNTLRADDLQNALNGTLYGQQGVYLNPFGPSNPGLLNALYFNSTNLYRTTGYDADVSVNGSLFEMPGLAGLPSGGNVGLAAGGEWHQDQINAQPDSSNLVGTNNGSPFTGERTVTSEFAEIDVPVLHRYLEVQAAVRHENYTSFGGTTKDKFAFGSQLTDFFKLRGSYSQSFKAPDLAQLDGGGVNYGTATTDPLNPAVPSQRYQQIIHANPNLKPEQGRILYLGGVFDLGGVVKGLSASVDYTNITVNNAIVPVSSYTPAQIFQYFPNLVVRNPNTNLISYFNLTPFNGTAYYYRGIDFSLDYVIRRTPAGDFKVSLQATRVLYLANNPGTGQGDLNYVGHYGFGGEVERWTGNAEVSWIHDKLSASLAALYKGPVLADANGTVAANTAWGVNPIALFNATASYTLPWGIRATVSCNNLFNTQPPANGVIAPSAGFDLASYGEWAEGRFLSLKLQKKF